MQSNKNNEQVDYNKKNNLAVCRLKLHRVVALHSSVGSSKQSQIQKELGFR